MAYQSKQGNEPKRDEKLAAQVVTSVLECDAQFMDTGTMNKAVDWELRYLDGTHVGLEVSSLTDRGLRKLAGAISGEKLSMLEGTTYSWNIGILPGTDVKTFLNACPRILAVLEAYDALTLPEEAAAEPARAAARELVDLGAVAFVPHENNSGTTELRLYPAWPWHSYHPGKDLNRLVNEQANDNSGKFLARNESDGHLFLWSDELTTVATSLTWEPAWKYIQSSTELPAGIGTVWVANSPWPTTIARERPVWSTEERVAFHDVELVPHVWCVRPPSNWEHLGDVRLRSTYSNELQRVIFEPGT